MESIRERLTRVSNERKDADAGASRSRLLKILTKKLQTTFIGDLAKFEKFFGRLWGHGKDDSECTENQLAWRDLWEQCRTEVLNNGNHQLRGVESEVAQYGIVWERFQIVLPARNQKEENDVR